MSSLVVVGVVHELLAWSQMNNIRLNLYVIAGVFGMANVILTLLSKNTVSSESDL